jgi:apolipoprotein N-acyltransferase
MEAKPFTGPIPTGVSICLEETYSHLIRELRLNGARLFVNISNDVWFPRSRLPEHHFQHGRIRAAENGVCLLRSCNTGITGAVDCCGRVVEVLPSSEEKVSVLHLNLPLRCFNTLYTWWGDNAVLWVSVCFVLLSISVRVLKKLQT